MFMKTSLILVAAAALAVPAAAAATDSSGGYASTAVRQVQFADLDLESEAGRAILDRRLTRAVKSICAVNPVLDSQAVAEEQARCESETMAALDGQVDAAVRANRARVTRTAGY